MILKLSLLSFTLTLKSTQCCQVRTKRDSGVTSSSRQMQASDWDRKNLAMLNEIHSEDDYSSELVQTMKNNKIEAEKHGWKSEDGVQEYFNISHHDPYFIRKKLNKKKLVKNKDRWKSSQLITINNYNKILPNKLPTESLSSAQLKFVKSDNQNTKIKGNLLVIDKKIKKVRKDSQIINLDIKKLQSWKSKHQTLKQNSIKSKLKEVESDPASPKAENIRLRPDKYSFQKQKTSSNIFHKNKALGLSYEENSEKPRFVFRAPPPFV